MKIFLTGGAGFIGSAVAAQLLAEGHQVHIYDSLITGHRAAIPEGATFTQADLADEGALSRALHGEEFDALMHFAAFIEAGESMLNPSKYFQNNLVNSLNLIEAAHQAGIDRIVFSSSAAVYQSSDSALNEDSPLGPQNVYGQTKLMIEEALGWYQQVHGLRFAALRYFNASGALPGRGEAHQPESHLIPLILQVALGQREKIHIFGTDYPTPDGSCIRDYIHLADLVAAHVLALEGLAKNDKLIFNIGSGSGFSVKEVIDAARKVTGHPIPAEESPRRAGDPSRLVASSERIQQKLGWRAQHSSLEEIISSAWDWHQSHPEGYPEEE